MLSRYTPQELKYRLPKPIDYRVVVGRGGGRLVLLRAASDEVSQSGEISNVSHAQVVYSSDS